jgi:hypothetical protein
MKNVRMMVVGVLALAIAGVTTACGSGAAIPQKDQVKIPEQTVSSPAAPVAKPSPKETHADYPNGSVGLAAAWTYKSGLSIRLADPKRGTSTADGVPSNKGYLSFDVVIKNGADKPFDMSDLYEVCTVNGRSADAVFDTEKGLDGSPDSHILPGQTLTYRDSCIMSADQHKIQVEFTPDYDDAPAIFVGDVA